MFFKNRTAICKMFFRKTCGNIPVMQETKKLRRLMQTLREPAISKSADDFQTDFIQRDCSACAGVARHENQLAGPLIQIRIC